LSIDLQGLHDFLALFCSDMRFYYGLNPTNFGSGAFMGVAKAIFGKSRVFTKPIQKIRHYLSPTDVVGARRVVNSDASGSFIVIPKCNFDVEISVDAIRLMDSYDTLCLLSSDADFVGLVRYLKSKGKKVILVKGGRIQGALAELADVKVNAQDIKQYISKKRQKPNS